VGLLKADAATLAKIVREATGGTAR
jgi:hypothetical protein